MGEPAVAAELTHQVATSGVEIAVRAALSISRARKIRRTPGFHGRRERTMALVEEWPDEEALIRH
jgi:4-aminobutyrate aminotransferase-like enzyme